MADIKVSKNFAEGVVVECYNQGLSKEAAAMVLDAVLLKESGMVKEAGGWGAVFRALGPAIAGSAGSLGRGSLKIAPAAAVAGAVGGAGYGAYRLGKHFEEPTVPGEDFLPAGMSAKEYANVNADLYNPGIAGINDRKTEILSRIQDAKIYGSPGEVEALQKQLKAVEGDVTTRQKAVQGNIKSYEKSYNHLQDRIKTLEGNKDAWWRKWVPFTDSKAEAAQKLAMYKQKLRATQGHLGGLRRRSGFMNSGATVYTPRSLNAHPSSNDYISNDFQRYVE